MEEQEIKAFIEWLPTKIKELEGKSPEEIVSTLNQISKTEEGMNEISRLIVEFKTETEAPKSELFKEGGKLAYLVNCYKKGGKTSDCGCNKKKTKILKGEDGLPEIDTRTKHIDHGKVIEERTQEITPKGDTIYWRRFTPNAPVGDFSDVEWSASTKITPPNMLQRFFDLFNGGKYQAEYNRMRESFVKSYRGGGATTSINPIVAAFQSIKNSTHNPYYQQNIGRLVADSLMTRGYDPAIVNAMEQKNFEETNRAIDGIASPPPEVPHEREIALQEYLEKHKKYKK